jgi:hemerythrin
LPELDEAHQAMFLLTHELRQAMVEGEEPEHLAHRARRLTDEVTSHLRHEEQLMRAARYPQTEWHKRQHNTVCAQLGKLTESIETEERTSMFDSLEAIAKWMRDHTSIADRMAGAYLRNYQRGLKR